MPKLKTIFTEFKKDKTFADKFACYKAFNVFLEGVTTKIAEEMCLKIECKPFKSTYEDKPEVAIFHGNFLLNQVVEVEGVRVYLKQFHSIDQMRKELPEKIKKQLENKKIKENAKREFN